MMTKRLALTVCGSMVVAILLQMAAARAQAPAIGEAVAVAPNAEKTICQMWPGAAWCESAKCWLVAWQEGNINEQETDIWCARVSADGKALDPAGIRITTAKDLQEQPAVACDGKNFLVVWQDFRNGKDYDVYAARVSAEGKVLDADGFLVAGGPHNQCCPTVAFAGGNYFVAWQAYTDEAPDKWGATGVYKICATRIGPEGKVIGNVVVLSGGDRINRCPSAVAWGEGKLLLTWRSKPVLLEPMFVTTLLVDAASGQPADKPYVLGPQSRHDRKKWMAPGTFVPATVWGANGGLCFVNHLLLYGTGNNFWLWRLDAAGKDAAGEIRGITGAGLTGWAQSVGVPPRASAVFDGERYLLTMDCYTGFNKTKTAYPGGMALGRMVVHGLVVPADGKLPGMPAQEGTDFKSGAELNAKVFCIAGNDGKEAMQGFAAAGPKNVSLVVYAELRGPDDTKVMARIVK